MQGHEPSRTALGAATHRAAHQVLEGGSIFRDPLACTILGRPPDEVAREASADPARRPLRLLIAARSRFAEDALADAVARGVRQAVVLGAGLDTLALRRPGDGVRVFEVDHPATQAFKRERLAAAGLAVPDALIFAPVDFEREDLAAGLARAGFDAGAPAFFAWLGVVPYLTPAAVAGTLACIAAIPGAEVVFDYVVPRDRLAPERRAQVDALTARGGRGGRALSLQLRPRRPQRAAPRARLQRDRGPRAARHRARLIGAPLGGAGAGEGPHLVRARRP